MNKYNIISTIFSCWLLLFLYQQAICTTAQVSDEDEGEFEYSKKSPRGPEHWGSLREEWAKCGNSTVRWQSPIDIVNSTVEAVSNGGQLMFNYKSANATVHNSGHDIEIEWIGDAGSAQFNGVNYSLVQCHWHSPAEHLIDGKRYDLELHMVHVNSSDMAALVVSQLYQINDSSDPFLSQFKAQIKSLTKTVGDVPMAGVVDPRSARTDTAIKYYNYLGSLTTPSCNGTVIWIVNETISTVAEKQVDLLSDAVFDYAERNARPVQPLNGRQILLYH
ncbi:hypothetical protein I3843_10G121900 [Carya illinoinensis]|nr:hypothetical protein I3760_10G129000 [Carya illinoinensis]KAG7960417.1 hypothetical protein I3843_10G121900 [Carya illinoinensis]